MRKKKTNNFMGWLFHKLKIVAWVNPFTKTVYFREDRWPPSIKLERHEQMHIVQIERFENTYGKVGRLVFTIHYSLLTLLHGYTNNPYEIEARMAESTAD